MPYNVLPIYNNNHILYGIDNSISSTGWSSYNLLTGEYKFGIISYSKFWSASDNQLQRMSDLYRYYEQRFSDAKIIMLEDYSERSRSKAKHQIAEICGILKYILYKNFTQIYTCPPRHLKKVITGNGNAEKPDMVKHIKNKFLKDFGVEYDIADSFGLLKLLMNILQIEETLKYDTSKIKLLY